jgi:hypothetical protein
MARPIPTLIYHFTHVRNLPGIVEHGLLCDSTCQETGATQTHIGDSAIKGRRRRKSVPVYPGGHVGDYVPFYFAYRSPMMFSLADNNYEYQDGFDDVVYLVSSLERLTDLGLRWIASDRNAARDLATFVPPDGDLDAHVDWPLMRERYWGHTDDDPDRPDRRMAECLVHRVVPWAAFDVIAARNAATARLTVGILADAGARRHVDVRPRWYF